MTVQGNLTAAETRRAYQAQQAAQATTEAAASTSFSAMLETVQSPQRNIQVPQRSVQSIQRSAQSPQRETLTRRFDSVSFTGESGKVTTYAMEARSRITREVRTATSSGQIAALRDEVQSGAYRPDPMATARKMLLLEVAV